MENQPQATSSASSTIPSTSSSPSTPPPPPSPFLPLNDAFDTLPPFSPTCEPTPSISPRSLRSSSTPISSTSASPFAYDPPLPQLFDSRYVLRRLNYIERVAMHLTNTLKHLHIKEGALKRVDLLEKGLDEVRVMTEYVDRLLSRKDAGEQEREERLRTLEERVLELEAGLKRSGRRIPRLSSRGRRGGVNSSSSSSSLDQPKPSPSKVASSSPPPVMIFWDSENCNISGQDNPGPIIRKLRSMFSMGPIKIFRYYTRTIHAWDNLPTFRARIAANGVELRDCPSWLGKGTVDHTLLVEIMAAALDFPPPATIVLISGDKDFSYLLNTLKNRGYNLIVVLGGHHFRGVEELRNPSTEVHRWSDILREVATNQADPAAVVEGPPVSNPNPDLAPTTTPNHRFTPPYRPPMDSPILEQKISFLLEHHKTNLLESLYALAKTNPDAFHLKKGERYYDVQGDLVHKNPVVVEGGGGGGVAAGLEEEEGVDLLSEVDDLEEGLVEGDLGAVVQETLLTVAEGEEAALVGVEGALGLEDRLEPGELEELARLGEARKRGSEGKRRSEGLGEGEGLGMGRAWKKKVGRGRSYGLERVKEDTRREEMLERVEESRRKFSASLSSVGSSSASSSSLSAGRRSYSSTNVASTTTGSSSFLRIQQLGLQTSSSYRSSITRSFTSRLVSSLWRLGRVRFGGR